MSNVPKSKRKQHDFETTRQMTQLRRDITEAVINDFGYDADRYQKMIDRYAYARRDQENVEATVAKMQAKHDSFYDAFIEGETRVIMQIWRDIVMEFELGNSIFPSGEALLEEYNERRLHFDRCIGHISGNYQFLQNKYTLTETGKVVMRVNPKTVTRERRRLKAYRRLLDRGVMSYQDIENAFKSWLGNYVKIMSKQQRKNILALYKNLFNGRILTWKQSTK